MKQLQTVPHYSDESLRVILISQTEIRAFKDKKSFRMKNTGKPIRMSTDLYTINVRTSTQRVLSAPDLKTARKGAMFAVLLKLLPVFIFALPGVIALALYYQGDASYFLQGEESKQTFVLLLNKLLPTGLRGLVLASLLAALISSLIAVFNSISTLVVRDFIVKFKPDMSEKGQVNAGRYMILIAAILGICAAYLVYKNEEGLYKYLQAITAYLVLPVFPAIFWGIISKRVTAKGAAISVLVGALLSTLFVIDQVLDQKPVTDNMQFYAKSLTAAIPNVHSNVAAITPRVAHQNSLFKNR